MRLPSLARSSDSVSRFRQRRRLGRLSTVRPVLVAAVGAGVAALVVWVVLFSSLLSVDRVRVEGERSLTAQSVIEAAGVAEGAPLARVRLDEVQERVEAIPAVEHAEVHRSWPHTVTIEVTEREPIAVVRRHGRWQGLDKDGVVFAAFTARPKGLPVVEIRAVSGDRAHQEAASVVQALPAEVLDRLKRLKAESIDSIELVLTDGRQVKWGSSDQSARKVEVLEVLLQHPAQVYDVSVPEQPTTRNL